MAQPSGSWGERVSQLVYLHDLFIAYYTDGWSTLSEYLYYAKKFKDMISSNSQNYPVIQVLSSS